MTWKEARLPVTNVSKSKEDGDQKLVVGQFLERKKVKSLRRIGRSCWRRHRMVLMKLMPEIHD